jgi:hypothetical protein
MLCKSRNFDFSSVGNNNVLDRRICEVGATLIRSMALDIRKKRTFVNVIVL